MKIIYNSPAGSAASGPYTPSITVSNAEQLLFVSGQGPVDPATGQKYLGEDIQKQARLTLENVKLVIEASNFTLDQVVKTTIFLKNINDMAAVNAVYLEYFPKNPPTRSTVQVADLPSGQAIEIEATAVA